MRMAAEKLMELVKSGMNPKEALEAFIGKEETEKFIEDLYNELRKKGAK